MYCKSSILLITQKVYQSSMYIHLYISGLKVKKKENMQWYCILRKLSSVVIEPIEFTVCTTGWNCVPLMEDYSMSQYCSYCSNLWTWPWQEPPFPKSHGCLGCCWMHSRAWSAVTNKVAKLEGVDCIRFCAWVGFLQQDLSEHCGFPLYASQPSHHEGGVKNIII